MSRGRIEGDIADLGHECEEVAGYINDLTGSTPNNSSE